MSNFFLFLKLRHPLRLLSPHWVSLTLKVVIYGARKLHSSLIQYGIYHKFIITLLSTMYTVSCFNKLAFEMISFEDGKLASWLQWVNLTLMENCAVNFARWAFNFRNKCAKNSKLLRDKNFGIFADIFRSVQLAPEICFLLPPASSFSFSTHLTLLAHFR